MFFETSCWLAPDSISREASRIVSGRVDNKEAWHSFAFVSYFNMWKLFGPMGFNGYSPYVICADIGLLTPPASQWRHAALTEADLVVIDELTKRARGRSWPTWQQNRFMAKLGKI